MRDKVRARNSNKFLDVVLEFLDVVTNQILYSRAIYPKAVFKLRSSYINLPVYHVQDPEVRSFICEGLSSLRSLLADEGCRFDRFEVVVLSEQETPVETYAFKIDGSGFECGDDDVIMSYPEIQREFRGILLRLTSKMADLKALNEGGDFSFTFRTRVKSPNSGREIRNMNWFHLAEDNESTFGPSPPLGDPPPPTTVIPVAKSKTHLRLEVQIECHNLD